MLGFLFFLFEAFGYVTPFFFDDIYDHREGVLERIDGNKLAELKEDRIDPLLGWKYYGPKVVSDCNCQGTEIEYSFDKFGTRTYSGYDGANAGIIVAGDSYSHGRGGSSG